MRISLVICGGEASSSAASPIARHTTLGDLAFGESVLIFRGGQPRSEATVTDASIMRTMKRDRPLEFPRAYETLLVTEHFPRLVRHAMAARRIAVRFYVASVSPHAV